jgi:hypothetical protein
LEQATWDRCRSCSWHGTAVSRVVPLQTRAARNRPRRQEDSAFGRIVLREPEAVAVVVVVDGFFDRYFTGEVDPGQRQGMPPGPSLPSQENPGCPILAHPLHGCPAFRRIHPHGRFPWGGTLDRTTGATGRFRVVTAALLLLRCFCRCVCRLLPARWRCDHMRNLRGTEP